MRLNLGIRITPSRVRVTKSLSVGRGLFWVRKGKVKASGRVK
jgi:hypothetical protein